MFGEAIVQYQLIFDINSFNIHHTSSVFPWIADFMLTVRWMSEWMIVFLTPIQQLFSYIIANTS